jgi:hypothetical protein
MGATSSRSCTRNHLATQASTTGQIGQYRRAGSPKAAKHSEEFVFSEFEQMDNVQEQCSPRELNFVFL